MKFPGGGEILLAAFDGDRVVAGGKIGDERMGRDRRVHFHGLFVVEVLLFVLHGRALRIGGLYKMPFALGRPQIHATGQGLARICVCDVGAEFDCIFRGKDAGRQQKGND